MNEPKSLRLRWQADGTEWTLEQMQELIKDAVSISDMHLAIDVSKSALAQFGPHPTTQYYQALAYANCGSRNEVFKLMETLTSTVSKADEVYIDVLSLLGRLEKDRFIRTQAGPGKDAALIKALTAYQDAYEITGASFPGINAATLFLLANETEEARKIAVAIITSNASDQEEFWQLATLAEAHILLEEYDSARHYYQQVVAAAGDNFGLLASIKKHLPLIRDKLRIPNDIMGLLNGPAIGVFSGHMLDTDDREEPRFPFGLKEDVAAAIGDFIDETKIKIGYSSAACGGDLLFCREMLNRGLEVNIVLPFAAEEFRRTSVALSGVDESREYWKILERANSVSIATAESHLNNPCLYTHAANLIEGYALLRAQQCDGYVHMIAAIDPYTEGDEGGTVSLTIDWLEQGNDVHIIDIGKLRGEVNTDSILPTIKKRPNTRHLDREIMSLVEVSSNTHDDVVHKVLMDRVPEEGDYLNGEGINRAFDNVKDAADYAYHVRALASMVKWTDLDLPEDTQLQIAIHTGPVFPRSKSKNKDYFGTHVFYARELAEVTPPGCIYLTEPAAALLLTHGPEDYVSDYLGGMQVKDFMRQIYRLHQA